MDKDTVLVEIYTHRNNLKNLYLKYHPDKNKSIESNEIFGYIRNTIEKLNKYRPGWEKTIKSIQDIKTLLHPQPIQSSTQTSTNISTHCNLSSFTYFDDMLKEFTSSIYSTNRKRRKTPSTTTNSASTSTTTTTTTTTTTNSSLESIEKKQKTKIPVTIPIQSETQPQSQPVTQSQPLSQLQQKIALCASTIMNQLITWIQIYFQPSYSIVGLFPYVYFTKQDIELYSMYWAQDILMMKTNFDFGIPLRSLFKPHRKSILIPDRISNETDWQKLICYHLQKLHSNHSEIQEKTCHFSLQEWFEFFSKSK